MPTNVFILEDPFFDNDEETVRTRRNLPHWSQEGKLYFITWRLADSLPQKVLKQLEADRKAWFQQYGGTALANLEPNVRQEWYRLFDHRVQLWLDAGHGSCILRKPEAKRIMADALHHFHDKRYHLGSFAIAGNHVHVLVAPHTGVELSRVIHSWKSFTSNAINKALGRTGRLWMDEYFDRILRNQQHLEHVEDYIAAHARQGAYVESRPS
jgi:REP element-mobilizing transposase RayT